jgi:ribosomal protein S18 acetylase RimI-like enzyme
MYNIEKMNIKDYEEIHDLWKNTDGMGVNEHDDSRESIEKFILKNPNSCFVVNFDNRIIGTIMGGNDGRRGLIYHLMVKPEHRKNGIGKKLIEKVENSIKKEGISKIYISVFLENEIGNNFWEKNGYEIRDYVNFRSKTLLK